MDDVFAKIAEETVTFNLGDENVGTIGQFNKLLIAFKLTRYEWDVN
jgi:prenylcysteine alpha-carboxyl methylesterase